MIFLILKRLLVLSKRFLYINKQTGYKECNYTDKHNPYSDFLDFRVHCYHLFIIIYYFLFFWNIFYLKEYNLMRDKYEKIHGQVKE